MIVLNPIVQARKAAQRERYRKWRDANPEKARAATEAWRAGNTEHEREYRKQYREKKALDIRLYSREWNSRDTIKRRRKDKRLWANYRITLADYEAMKSRQGGKCAICKERPVEAVDHCHATGAVRGLLCHSCNKGIGFFADRLSLLSSAMEYLSVLPEPPPPPPVAPDPQQPPSGDGPQASPGEAGAVPAQVPPEMQPA